MVFKEQRFEGARAEIEPDYLQSKLEELAARALSESVDLDATDISVTELHGQIVLDGTVARAEEIRTAEDIIRRLVGEKNVINRISAR